MTRQQVLIATDGSCIGNPGPGGWGAVLTYGEHVREISGSAPATTNNRMELLAAIEALEALKRPCAVTILADSKYVIDGASPSQLPFLRAGRRPGRKAHLRNADLWARLAEAADPHQVLWIWVRGHAGHPLNERADLLARSAARAAMSRTGTAPRRQASIIDHIEAA